MKNIIKLFSVVVLLVMSSCDTFDLEGQLDNPNEVSVGNLDINLLMNSIQTEFGDFLEQANEETLALARYDALASGSGQYSNAFLPQDFDDMWNRAYQDVLIQIETLLELTDAEGFTNHSGVARILKAYVLLTLVDLYGDIPNSEALKGDEGNFNPGVDSGAEVYADAISTLDQAIAQLTTPVVTKLDRDVFYGNNYNNWIALANTLKLKAYMNTSLVDESTAKTEINKLLAVNIIDTPAESFTYRYGTADIPARSRHPLYLISYRPVAGSTEAYINNDFMRRLYKGYGSVQDPRWRYYFYRQVGSVAKALEVEPEAIPCVFSPPPAHYQPFHAFCSFDPGFFGRDHGNTDGIPPDTRARTAYGVYPVGGKSDVNNGNTEFEGVTQQGQGANGGGIQPIWMSFFTDFLKAEAAARLGIGGDAKALLLTAITNSIAEVRAFATAKGQSLPADLEPSTEEYLNAVSNAYDAASTKMNVVGEEAYKAYWGNGVEGYNHYRRTGQPVNAQPMRAENPGAYLRSLPYPAEFVNLNSSTSQKDNTKVNKVFWDNNPDNFVY